MYLVSKLYRLLSSVSASMINSFQFYILQSFVIMILKNLTLLFKSKYKNNSKTNLVALKPVCISFENIKNKTKEGKKLKKKKQLEDQEEKEEPDCEPPAPKKKKKKDKLVVDQVNGDMDDATDMNGNSNGVETPKQKIKKNTEADTEVSTVWENCSNCYCSANK